VEVNTVDGFQGREKDIIIFSTVRSNINSKKPTLGRLDLLLGFLTDIRRMNVSLSRARVCLIVVGDLRTLNLNKQWRGLIDFAVKNQAAYNTDYIRGSLVANI
jgi:superfamily I DNA and/or RNA helicase